MRRAALPLPSSSSTISTFQAMKIAEVLSLILNIVILAVILYSLNGCADTKPFRIDSIEYGNPAAVEEAV